MDWLNNIKSSMSTAASMGDYERQRYGSQGGMQAGSIPQKSPDIIVNAPPVSAPPMASMPAPTYNINNTYSYSAQAPTFTAPQAPTQLQLPEMPQMPQIQPLPQPEITPPPAAPAPAPPKPEPQQQQEPQKPQQEYHGNLGVDSGAFSQGWQSQWSKPQIKIPW